MRWALLPVTLALTAFGSANAQVPSSTEVDVELVLAVDVSWSMDRREQELQRDGYVAAFRDPRVQDAILKGPNGRVAIAYVEWAGQSTQSVVIPWTLIDTRESADAFAYRLSVEEADRERRTSISSAIDFVTPMFENNGFEGLRRVIDMSGDGPNNQGRPVTQARDAAIAGGITINGLPLMTQDDARGSWGSIAHLDRYYRDCVIGGPGAFMIPVTGWDQFPDAVRRKLIMELANLRPATPPAAEAATLWPVASRGGSDCLIGETLWQQRQDRWGPN